ncbi:ABC transporter permease [Pontibacillus halophilus JSM 076056 = DSM 19796]|uniref:ABC transporter permease n=1 Tax=Pontibacillus halophilus JSM 076056 = DSM 19796 TaxID=1385510 RepID=A0A0A5GIF1_9BACI|nr:ABC transporter permease [Pontibacillus halophilus]KGX92996.1 ABC transporter permease [Pontibacillus halophilus JSM 076056 = DSM 19796]
MNSIAISKRILRQFRRDKRSMALMIMAPLLVLTLMWLVFDGEQYEPKIGLVEGPAPFTKALESQDAELASFTTKEDAFDELESGELDGVIYFEGREATIQLEGSNPNEVSAVRKVVQSTTKTLSEESKGAQPLDLSFSFLHGGEDLGLFDNVGPVLVGFFVFFFVFITGGVSFLRERTQGTLERLLSTPLKRFEIVMGYVIGFGIFTLIQTLVIVSYSIYVLDMWMVGNIGYVLLITFILALTALTLGTLLSTYAKSEFQMFQFIPLVIIPQVFFSGMFSLETMTPWLRWLQHVLPLSYGAEALRDVMIRDAGFIDIWVEMVVLIAFVVLFFTLNVLALRKHRKL